MTDLWSDDRIIAEAEAIVAGWRTATRYGERTANQAHDIAAALRKMRDELQAQQGVHPVDDGLRPVMDDWGEVVDYLIAHAPEPEPEPPDPPEDWGEDDEYSPDHDIN